MDQEREEEGGQEPAAERIARGSRWVLVGPSVHVRSVARTAGKLHPESTRLWAERNARAFFCLWRGCGRPGRGGQLGLREFDFLGLDADALSGGADARRARAEPMEAGHVVFKELRGADQGLDVALVGKFDQLRIVAELDADLADREEFDNDFQGHDVAVPENLQAFLNLRGKVALHRVEGDPLVFNENRFGFDDPDIVEGFFDHGRACVRPMQPRGQSNSRSKSAALAGGRFFVRLFLVRAAWGVLGIPSSILRMGKTLVIVSIALSAIAGVLGFLNRQTLSVAKADLASAQQERDRTSQTLSQVQGELGTSKKSVEELTSKNQASESENAKLKADLAGKKSELEKLFSSVSEKESEIVQLKTEIETKTQEIATLQTSAAAPEEAQSNDEQARIAELETLNTELNSRLDSTRGELEVFKQKEKEKLTRQALNSLAGRILAVNQAWNFVVLNIGDRNGILSNTELIVKRGTARIGRVRITSVEPSTSIADIIPGSMVRGLSIQPGDDVIYQVETN